MSRDGRPTDTPANDPATDPSTDSNTDPATDPATEPTTAAAAESSSEASSEATGERAPSAAASAANDEMDRAIAQRIDSVLPLGHDNEELASYYELLREYPSRSGKGLRGRLTLLSTAAHGASWRKGLAAAAAIELFQNWVLIHDDVEDDSDERRGEPTMHRQVGVPLAINVGDGLHAYMWQLLLSDASVPPAVVHEFLWLIHRTSEGQHLDLSWVEQGRWDVSEPEYLEMVRLKTACYTVISPLRLGAGCAGVVPDGRLSAAGEDLGVAFQIRDDVLNLTPGAPHGKEFAGDLFEGKRTLILAHFFELAGKRGRARAVELLSSARGQRSDSDVRELLDLLEGSGSVEYAQSVAEERARRGLATLEAAMRDSANREQAAALVELLSTLTHRNS